MLGHSRPVFYDLHTKRPGPGSFHMHNDTVYHTSRDAASAQILISFPYLAEASSSGQHLLCARKVQVGRACCHACVHRQYGWCVNACTQSARTEMLH